MQLGRTHLTPEERLRRIRAGECLDTVGSRVIFWLPVHLGQKTRYQ